MRERLALGSAALILPLVLWEVIPRIVAVPRGVRLFVATPSQIAVALAGLVTSGELQQHFTVSALEFLIGLGLSIAVGLPLGVLFGRVAWLDDLVDPFVTALNATPRIVWLPLLIPVVRPRDLVEGADRVPRCRVPAAGEHLRGREERRPGASERRALVRWQLLAGGQNRRAAGRAAVRGRRIAARDRARRPRRRRRRVLRRQPRTRLHDRLGRVQLPPGRHVRRRARPDGALTRADLLRPGRRGAADALAAGGREDVLSVG